MITRKGKGYEFAETSPDKYHGVAPFEIANGIPPLQKRKDKKYSSFSEAFADSLCGFASGDKSIAAISAAMSSGTGLDSFESMFPDRFFDVGIAEQHAITMAAGMACAGIKPVVAIYSTFLQRAYDQWLHDIALQDLHVVTCIARAAIVGEDGETHQGIYDIALLNSVPGMTIFAPRDFNELNDMLDHALFSCKGPVAIRYPRGGEPASASRYHVSDEADRSDFSPRLLEQGNDVTIVTEGIMFSYAVQASEMLKDKGITCDIIDIRTLKPINDSLILASARKTGAVVTVENGISHGGMGSCVESILSDKRIDACITKLGVKDRPLLQGKISELLRSEKLDAEGICEAVCDLLQKH